MKHDRPQTDSIEDDAFSALADGALHGDAFAAAMTRLAVDDESRSRWHAYHVVGDVLRSEDLSACKGDLAFLEKLETRLALEPKMAMHPVVAPMVVPKVAAANGDVFRWKLVAGFASLAAVAAIGWQTLQLQGAGTAPVLAQASVGAPASGIVAVRADAGAAAEYPNENAPVMLRNAQLDELLAAHNQAVGGAALQSQARMLRNVSITEDLPR